MLTRLAQRPAKIGSQMALGEVVDVLCMRAVL
jgi:hypothetical protein